MDIEDIFEFESVGVIVLINSSAVTGAILTFGGDNGDNKSKSYKDKSMSPNISSLLIIEFVYEDNMVPFCKDVMWFVWLLLITLCETNEFWFSEIVDDDDTEGDMRVVNEVIELSLLLGPSVVVISSESDTGSLSPQAKPFEFLTELFDDELLVEELKLSTELQLRFVNRSELSSEFQKALDCEVNSDDEMLRS